MVVESTGGPASDPVRIRLGEASLRLLAGVVPPSTMAELRGAIMSSSGAFPWQVVTERILADPVADARLVEAALRAQRDWILRTGRPKGRRSLKTKGKNLLAFLLVRSVFTVVYAAAVIAVLILLKYHWPAVDIYSLLTWLHQTLPALFRHG